MVSSPCKINFTGKQLQLHQTSPHGRKHQSYAQNKSTLRLHEIWKWRFTIYMNSIDRESIKRDIQLLPFQILTAIIPAPNTTTPIWPCKHPIPFRHSIFPLLIESIPISPKQKHWNNILQRMVRWSSLRFLRNRHSLFILYIYIYIYKRMAMRSYE